MKGEEGRGGGERGEVSERGVRWKENDKRVRKEKKRKKGKGKERGGEKKEKKKRGE